VGDTYAPSILIDHGGLLFCHVNSQLVQHNILDLNRHIIPPWEEYKALTEGTLVITTISIHTFIMPIKNSQGNFTGQEWRVSHISGFLSWLHINEMLKIGLSIEYTQHSYCQQIQCRCWTMLQAIYNWRSCSCCNHGTFYHCCWLGACNLQSQETMMCFPWANNCHWRTEERTGKNSNIHAFHQKFV